MVMACIHQEVLQSGPPSSAAEDAVLDRGTAHMYTSFHRSSAPLLARDLPQIGVVGQALAELEGVLECLGTSEDTAFHCMAIVQKWQKGPRPLHT